MTTTTGNQGLPYPLKGDGPGFIAEYIEALAKAVEKKVVATFASATIRDATLVGIYAPVLGQVCLLTDSLTLMKYNGVAWVNAMPTITASTASPSGGNNGDIWLKI